MGHKKKDAAGTVTHSSVSVRDFTKDAKTIERHIKVKLWRRPLGLFAGLLTLLALSTIAYAVSSQLPDPPNQGSITSLLIGRVGGDSTLPSPETSVKLIYSSAPDIVDVFDGGYCVASKYDHKTDSATSPCGTSSPNGEVYYDFQALNNDTGAVGPVLRVLGSTMAGNGGVNANYRVNLSGLVGAVKSTDNKYFVKVRIYWQKQNDPTCVKSSPISAKCQTGTNFFRFTIPPGGPRTGDLITYNVVNANSSPLSVENDGPGAPKYSNMTFEFAPDCAAAPADLSQPLKWQDADYGENNQDGDISWDLYEISPTNVRKPIAHQENGQLGSQGSAKQYPQPNLFRLGYKYQWVWNHVDRSNGVTLFLPFDSYNYVRLCGSVDINKTSNAPPNLKRGDTFAYFLSVSKANTTLTSLVIKDNLPAELSYVPDPAFNVPAPDAPGTGPNLTWTFGSGSPTLTQLNATGVTQIKFMVMVKPSVPLGDTSVTNSLICSSVDISSDPIPCGSVPVTDTIAPPDPTNKPYFTVTNGDVNAGGAMTPAGAGSTACSVPQSSVPQNNNASIVSWSRDPAGGDYAGAGGRYGAFVLNHLQEFATAQGSGATPKAPTGLSFANAGAALGTVSPSTGMYGGKFGGASCIGNYFANAVPANTTTGPAVLSTLPGFPAGGNVANGTKFSRYIDGDLYIDSNVMFSAAKTAGGYPTVASIPTFSIVVRGNIYVDKSVTQLDGFYIAQPSTTNVNKGIIYTCAIGSTPFTAAPLLKSLQDNCDATLTVNGGFVARQVWLLRTAGTVTNNTSAEIFNYTPEFWLSAPLGNSLSTGATDYNAITTLPPIL